MNILQLTTERLLLRNFKNSDFSDFREYITDYRVNKNLGIQNPESEETINHLFKTNLENPFCWAVILKKSNKVIGDFHFDNIVENRLAHFGFAMNYNYQRQGYGFEASKKIIEFGFDEMGLGRIRAISLAHNIASINLLKKLDFDEEALIYEYDFAGTLGDVFYFSKTN